MGDDSKASWLLPSRALLQPFIADPNARMELRMYLDGEEVTLSKSYNSRGREVDSCFLGFYYDASDLKPDISHHLAVHMPSIGKGAFQGIFWENVVTEFSEDVVSCHLAI